MPSEILILADPNGNAWNFAEEVYKRLNSNPKKERNSYLGKVEIKRFNDGELFPKPLESVRGKECYLVHDCSMYPQDWIASLLFLNDAIGGASAKILIDVLPYLKYSRQDRVTEPRAPINANVLAKAIKSYADGLITADMHNPAVVNAYREKHFSFENLRAYPIIVDFIKENHSDFLKNAILEAPDAGATQITNSYAKRMKLGMVCAYKKRENPGVIESIEIMGDVNGKNVLITDDMIDTAGTLCEAAKKTKEKGANKIYACATHGIFSKDAKQRIENSSLEKVIVTDSIPQKSEGKIEVVSLTDLFADVIYRISHDISISELYK